MNILDYITALKLVYPYVRRILIDVCSVSSFDYRAQLIDTDNPNAVIDNGTGYTVDSYHTICMLNIERELVDLEWKYGIGNEVVINARNWSNPYKDNYISITCNKNNKTPLMMDFTIKVCNK